MDVLIRADEACQPDPFLLWDSAWDADNGIADWRLAGPGAPQNSGGLQAAAALDTAVTLCLFTDAAMPAHHPLARYVADGDPRGWWGDGIDVRADLGEGPLGSLLWILFRMPCNAATAMWAQILASQALAPLQSQGAVVEIDVSAAVTGLNAMTLTVALYGRDGQLLYDRRFDLIWDQLQQAA
jgi:phage gp46-like protein